MPSPKPSDDPTPPGEGLPRWLWIAFLAATAGLLSALWCVDYLPTHDGPLHIFAGHLENHFDDPGAVYPTYIERGHPFTAIGFHLLFSPLEGVLPWRTAFRVALSIIALIWAFGHLAVCASLDRRRAVTGLLGFASGVPWFLYMGFFSFMLSSGLGLLVLAAAIARWPWTPVRRVALAGAITIVAAAHAFGAVVTGVALLALVVARTGERPAGGARVREVALLAVMGLPALAIAATPRSMDLVRVEWLPLHQWATGLPRMFLPGPLWRAWVPVLLGLAGVVAAAVRARQRRLAAPEVALLAVSAACFVLVVALPLNHTHWEFLSPRVLPSAILLGAALVPVEQLSTRSRRAFSGGLVAFTALSLVVAVRTSVALRARVDEAMSGLSQPIHRDGPRLCAEFDDKPPPRGEASIPYMSPVQNIGVLYTLEQGGLCPYLFAGSPSLHPFVFSEEGKAKFPKALVLDYYHEVKNLDPERRGEVLTLVARTAFAYQDVVLVGKPSDGDALIERGCVADFRRGGLFMGHCVGCPVQIEVDTPRKAGEVVALEYGFGDERKPQWSVAAAASEAEDRLRITPPIALCGRMWLRGALVPDPARGVKGPRRFCAGADQEGKLRVEARAGAVLECNLAGP